VEVAGRAGIRGGRCAANHAARRPPLARGARSGASLGRPLSSQYYIPVIYLCSHYSHINNYHTNQGSPTGGVAPPTTLLGALHSRGALVLGPRWADPLSSQYYIPVNYLCSHYSHINNYHTNQGSPTGGVAPPTTLLGTLHSRGALVLGPRSADPCRRNNIFQSIIYALITVT